MTKRASTNHQSPPPPQPSPSRAGQGKGGGGGAIFYAIRGSRRVRHPMTSRGEIFTAGIDIGSISAESVIFNERGGVLGYSIVLTGGNGREASEVSLENALRCSNIDTSDVAYTISTGCGREIVAKADERVTEITCVAKGVNYLFPGCRTIIDIGGQDTKVIQTDGKGKVLAFDMNDKCAAGTGRFLEVMARGSYCGAG